MYCVYCGVQGRILPECDVFRDVVISNVSVCQCVGFYGVIQVRSLADSDEVFESACDLNEVKNIYVYQVYSVLQNLLDDSDMEEGEIISEVLCFLCVRYVIVVQVVVEENIIVIPDVSSVNLNQVI